MDSIFKKDKMKTLYTIKKIARKWRDKLLYIYRQEDILFLKEKLVPESGQHCSVLSMNCFGGHIYQDFNMPYESPTAGLFFFADDFCSILENISILKRDIVFLSKSKWQLANDKMPTREHLYPIGCFEGTDIEIHFLHYYTEKEARDKWVRRMERFNFENFIAIGFQQNECTRQTIERFERINVVNKVFFTNWNIKLNHVVYIQEFKDKASSPDPYKYANTYYKYLVDYIKMNPLMQK